MDKNNLKGTYLALALRSHCCDDRVLAHTYNSSNDMTASTSLYCLSCMKVCMTKQMCDKCRKDNCLCGAGDFLKISK